jgi:ComF family protein
MPTLAALRLKLPSQCEVCRAWGAAALCHDCVTRFAAPAPRCPRCGLRLGAPAAACGECLREPPPFERTVCAADYAFPWDRLVAAFKFEGRPELAAVLASRMAAAVRAAAAPRPDLVIPVPLAPARLADRGYNQAWELARRIARTLDLPSEPHCLQRPLDTAHQADLSRAERLQNLRAAFMVEPRHRGALAGRRIALVDDVMTTGATATEAARALLRAGAAAVELWVLARTAAD